MSPVTCHRCGAVLPHDSAAPCPRCLLQPRWDRPRRGAITLGPGQLFDPPSVEDLNQHLSGYEVLELIGRGGMGAVYRGRQLSLDRPVAIKILPPVIAERVGFSERFVHEGRALAKLNHPNIVAVHDYGQAGPYAMLVMELVDGANLRDVLALGKLTPEEAFEIIPQLCDALSYAHAQGVVHRDIKPENLLFEQHGRLKITDFGLAKIMAPPPAESPDPPSGDAAGELVAEESLESIVGTVHYMAPEQIERPGKVDHRADLYALGVLFYEMLTGELPLGRFEPPSHRVQLDVRLDEVVLKALEKQPQRRYSSASEIGRDVDAVRSTPRDHAHASPGPAFAHSASPQRPSPTENGTGRTVGDWLHTTTGAIARTVGESAAMAASYTRTVVSALAWKQSQDPAVFYGGLSIAMLVTALLTTSVLSAQLDPEFALFVWLPLTLIATLAQARYGLSKVQQHGLSDARARMLHVTLRLLYFPIVALGLLWPMAALLGVWGPLFGLPRDPWQPGPDGWGWQRDWILLGCGITVAVTAWWAALLAAHLAMPSLLAFLFKPLVSPRRRWTTVMALVACGVVVAAGGTAMAKLAYETPAPVLFHPHSPSPPLVDYSRYSPRDVARIQQVQSESKARRALDAASRYGAISTGNATEPLKAEVPTDR